MCYRNVFRVLSQNKEYVEKFCKDLINPFHFACCKRYLDNQTP